MDLKLIAPLKRLNLRSVSLNHIYVEKFSTLRCQRSIKYQGAKIWNAIPLELRDQSYRNFKLNYKKILLEGIKHVLNDTYVIFLLFFFFFLFCFYALIHIPLGATASLHLGGCLTRRPSSVTSQSPVFVILLHRSRTFTNKLLLLKPAIKRLIFASALTLNARESTLDLLQDITQ